MFAAASYTCRRRRLFVIMSAFPHFPIVLLDCVQLAFSRRFFSFSLNGVTIIFAPPPANIP